MTTKNDLTPKRGILVDARTAFDRNVKRSCAICVYIHSSYKLCKLRKILVDRDRALKCTEFRKNPAS